MVDINENGLYLAQRRLERCYPASQVIPEVADIRDPERIRRLFARYEPHDVFHAAAHKHVPLMEANPGEAVKNNVAGHQHRRRSAPAKRDAERFVLISTDKAVHPTSVMGASKRVAEMLRAGAGRAGPRRGSSPSASATCSARPAAWCRSSGSRSPRRAGHRHRIPT